MTRPATRDLSAHEEAYVSWRKKVLERMQPKRAPAVPPHPFGTKHPSLEERYFEVYNPPNSPSSMWRESLSQILLRKASGRRMELDVLALAAGFGRVAQPAD